MTHNLDDMMAAHIQAILEKESPTVQELELARKYMNDHKRRAFERALEEVDPTATAAKVYGLQFDAPLRVTDVTESLEE